MDNKIIRALTWAARILGIVTPIFIGNYLVKRIMFNRPVLGFPISYYTFELVEILLFCILLIVAWRWPIAGGIMYLAIWPFFFFLIALEHAMSPRGRGPSLFSTIPPLLAGVLFLIGGLMRRRKARTR